VEPSNNQGRKIVLHIGPHKTGSTYLQHRLLKSRAALNAAGWEYPEYALSQFAQHQLYHWLNGNNASAGNVSEAGFKDLLERNPRLILSSEDFVYFLPERIRRLRGLLGDAPVEVVYFLRTPVDLWPSHWQELVRHGRDDTLLEYLAAYAGWTKAVEPSSMNPVAHLRKYADVFGQDALKIICYDNIVSENGDIFEFFWRNVLGLRHLDPPGTARVIHPSQPLHMIEMLRNLNQLYRTRRQQSPRDRVLAAYQKQQKSIEASAFYEGFRAAFAENASEVKLSFRHELVRSLERRVFSMFGDQIINRAAQDRTYVRDNIERVIPYGQRFWADKYGFANYIGMVLDGLELD
jgi:hypothetical protein